MKYAVLLVALLTSTAISQEVGENVVVIAEGSAELKVGKDVVQTVGRGNLLRIEKSNDNSYLVTWEHQSGWIDKADVLKPSAALQHFTEAIERKPTAHDYAVRGGLRWRRGEYDLSIADLSEAIRRVPDRPDFWLERGNAWGGKGAHDIAIADLTEAIRLNPQYALAYYNRGGVWFAIDEYDKAISDYSEAIRLHQQLFSISVAFVYSNRGLAWHHKGEYDRAISDYNQAVWNAPTPTYTSLFYNNRAKSWCGKREYDKALADYEQAIRLSPENASIHNGHGWFLATCPNVQYRDGKEAIKHATKACELNDWKYAYDFDTLAAAYAEADDFQNAVKWQQKAIGMADEQQKSDYEARPNLYNVGKPYREKSHE